MAFPTGLHQSQDELMYTKTSANQRTRRECDVMNAPVSKQRKSASPSSLSPSSVFFLLFTFIYYDLSSSTTNMRRGGGGGGEGEIGVEEEEMEKQGRR